MQLLDLRYAASFQSQSALMSIRVEYQGQILHFSHFSQRFVWGNFVALIFRVGEATNIKFGD